MREKSPQFYSQNRENINTENFMPISKTAQASAKDLKKREFGNIMFNNTGTLS